MRFRYDANSADSKLYQRWNKTTALCYFRNMVYKDCPNDFACDMNKDSVNTYGLRQVKFSVLMTYRNIGKPDKKFLESEEK